MPVGAHRISYIRDLGRTRASTRAVRIDVYHLLMSEAVSKGRVELKTNCEGKASCWKKFHLSEIDDNKLLGDGPHGSLVMAHCLL